MVDAPFSLYVHAPFCKVRCDYCDFYSTVGSNPQKIMQWYDSIRIQLERMMIDLKISSFETIYIGGGTPSMLPLPILRNLLHFLQFFFKGSHSREWTIEANPEDITTEFLDVLAQSNISRISLGVQSLDDTIRTAVNRRASAASILDRLRFLSGTWKGSWSIDYIYGFPFQDLPSIRTDFSKLVEYLPDHVSLYELGVEKGTALSQNIDSGLLRLPDTDDAIDVGEAASEFLTDAGFSRYEVSNWQRGNHECVHNERYWQMENWLGIGPSAVGNWFLEDKTYRRATTTANLDSFCIDPFAEQGIQVISGKDAIFETIMMALRTKKGLSFPILKDRFLFDPKPLMNDITREFPGFFSLDDSRCSTTSQGMDLLNLPLRKILDKLDELFPAGEP